MRRSAICTRKFQPPRLSANSAILSESASNNSNSNHSYDNNKKTNVSNVNSSLLTSSELISSSPLHREAKGANKRSATKRTRSSAALERIAGSVDKENKENVKSVKQLKKADISNNNNNNNTAITSFTGNEVQESTNNKQVNYFDRQSEQHQHQHQQQGNHREKKENAESLMKNVNSSNNANNDSYVDDSYEEYANTTKVEHSEDEDESKEESSDNNNNNNVNSLHLLHHAWQVNTVRPNQSREAVRRVVYYPPLKPPSTLSTPIEAAHVTTAEPIINNNIVTNNTNNNDCHMNINQETMSNVQVNTADLYSYKPEQPEQQEKSNWSNENDTNKYIKAATSKASQEHLFASPEEQREFKSSNLAHASLSPFNEMEGASQHTEFLRALEFQQQQQQLQEQRDQWLHSFDQQVTLGEESINKSAAQGRAASINNEENAPLVEHITSSKEKQEETNALHITSQTEEYYNNDDDNDSNTEISKEELTDVSSAIRRLFSASSSQQVHHAMTPVNRNNNNDINNVEMFAALQQQEQQQEQQEHENVLEYPEEQEEEERLENDKDVHELMEDEELLERELEEDIRLSTDIAFTPTTSTVNMQSEIDHLSASYIRSNNINPGVTETIMEENTYNSTSHEHDNEQLKCNNYHNQNNTEEEQYKGENRECESNINNAIDMFWQRDQLKNNDNTLIADEEKSISLCEDAHVHENVTNTITNTSTSTTIANDKVYPLFLPISEQPTVPGQTTRARTIFRFKSHSMAAAEQEVSNTTNNSEEIPSEHSSTNQASIITEITNKSTSSMSTDGRPKRTLFVFKTNTESSSNSNNNNNNNNNNGNNDGVTENTVVNDKETNVEKKNAEFVLSSHIHEEQEESSSEKVEINCDVDNEITPEVKTEAMEEKQETNEYEAKISIEEVKPAMVSAVAEEPAPSSSPTLDNNNNNNNDSASEEIYEASVTSASERTFYDLPSSVGVLFATHRGVHQLYPWQHNVLIRHDIRNWGNFVYSMPTSGGKTLVAEIALLRCVLLRAKSCMFVLPFVSLAEEKTVALQPFAEAFDFNVDGHYGMTGRFPLPKSPSLFVCTIEKANSVLNYLIEENLSDELGAVVVDELHMLGESRRGAILELFLSKLLVLHDTRNARTENFHCNGNNEELHQRITNDTIVKTNNKTIINEEIREEEEETTMANSTITAANTTTATIVSNPLQIIGMSATVPNLHEIADWLHASYFEGHLRPVPLHQYSVVEGMVLRDGTHNERNLNGSTESERLFELATEVDEASVLIFCASRLQCVETAKAIVKYQRELLIRSASVAIQDHLRKPEAAYSHVNLQTTSTAVTNNINSNNVEEQLETLPFLFAHETPELMEALRSLPPQAAAAIENLLSELYSLSHNEAMQLAEVVPFGVAFHHGGLLAEERELIERAYRQRHIRILCCTSTLAAGVNLPARRVIFKTPYMGREFLNKSRYLQMCGRAGRAGWDKFGESFLLLSRRDRQRGHRLMHQELEKCESQILEDAESFARALLECVGVKLITSLTSAEKWITRLFCYYALGPVDGNLTQAHLTTEIMKNYKNESLVNTKSKEVQLLKTQALINHALHYALKLLLKSGLVKQRRVLVTPSREHEQQQQEEEYNKVISCENESKCINANAQNAMLQLPLYHNNQDENLPSLLTSNENSNTIDNILAAPDEYTTVIGESAFCNNNNNDNNNNIKTNFNHEEYEVLIEVTAFGASSVRSCFSIDEAVTVREELEQLRENGLILADDLHLCYFLTPLREVGNCDWGLYRVLLSRLSDTRQAIANMIGVNEYLIDQRAMGLGGTNSNSNSNTNSLGGSEPVTEDTKRQLFIARRFYVALMLADVLAEVPMEEIEPKYHVNRGQLQSLMRSASMFSSSITSFCHAMEWFSLEAVLSSFVKRLDFGVKPDLVPLMEIKGVQPARARALWNAGFRDAASIASCEVDEMVQKVRKGNPPDSKAAKFFSKRSALTLMREAHVVLERQIKARKGELQALTNRFARSETELLLQQSE